MINANILIGPFLLYVVIMIGVESNLETDPTPDAPGNKYFIDETKSKTITCRSTVNGETPAWSVNPLFLQNGAEISNNKLIFTNVASKATGDYECFYGLGTAKQSLVVNIVIQPLPTTTLKTTIRVLRTTMADVSLTTAVLPATMADVSLTTADNTTAIIAGIVCALVLLAIIAAIIILLCRRGDVKCCAEVKSFTLRRFFFSPKTDNIKLQRKSDASEFAVLKDETATVNGSANDQSQQRCEINSPKLGTINEAYEKEKEDNEISGVYLNADELAIHKRKTPPFVIGETIIYSDLQRPAPELKVSLDEQLCEYYENPGTDNRLSSIKY